MRLNKTSFLTLFSVLCLCRPALCNMALRGKTFSSEAPKVSKYKELQIVTSPFKGREVGINVQDVAYVVPMNLRTTNDGNMVRDQVLLKSANSILKSSMIKNSSLMKTAKKVENQTKLDVAIKSAPTLPNEKPIEHKFNVDIQALKKEAKLTYKGYVDSRIEYRVETDSLRVSVEEKLSKNARIALTHDKGQGRSQQYLQYNYSW